MLDTNIVLHLFDFLTTSWQHRGFGLGDTEAKENSDSVAEEATSESTTVVELEANPTEAEEATLGTAADKDIDDTIVHETETDSSAAVVDEVCPDEIYDNETSKSDHTSVVHAVATFRNSPNDTIGQDDINSLQNFIYSEEHLQRNIVKIEFEKLSRWEVSTKLYVLTNNLWEGPRSYIWKHLGGQNLWDKLLRHKLV